MPPFPHLLSPITLSGVTLPNRVLMGSMHTGLEERGDWNRVAAFYATRARGGVGLMVTGGMAPNPEGGVFPGAAGLFTAQDIANHRMVTERVHAAGGKIAMQILHAGRYAYGKDCVSASALKSPISPFAPRVLDDAGIEKQISNMVTAAVRAQEAGYDGVEVMGSEGYFLNQFLSLQTNKRDDGWGGSYENRMRLPVAVVARVRAAVGGNFILIYRISLLDLVPEGQSWDEIALLARAVAAAGASVLNTGIGWHEARVPTIATSVPRAAFSWLTARLRPLVDVPVIASNRINSPDVAEGILARGEADMVSMARPFLADPAFVAKAASARVAEIAPCIGCNQACLDHTFSGRLTSCLVNPRACHELELRLEPAAVARRIAVVGAGAAGMACAIAAADRGHIVVLYERAAEVGGQLRLAALVPGKEEFQGLIGWFEAEIVRAGVDLRLGTAPDVAELTGYDAVVVASGVAPRQPGIPGEELAVSYPAALRGAALGRRVAVIGAGGIGFDVATALAESGVSATLQPEVWRREWGVGDPAVQPGGLAVARPEPAARQIFLLQRRAERPGRGLGRTTGWIHRTALLAKGVVMQGGAEYVRIVPEGLVLRRDGVEELLAVEDVVLCAGQVSVRRLADDLAAAGIRCHVIGGADVAAELDAKRAIDQGVRLAAVL